MARRFLPSGKKITPSALRNLRAAGITSVEVENGEFEGAITAADVVDMSTGELLYEANQELSADKLHKIAQSGVTTLEVFFPERDDVGTIIANTLRRDSVRKPEEALIEIYRKLRPGDPPTLDTATALFEGMFFDPRKYDFSRVGRLKFNIKLYESADATQLDKRTLTPEDFYGTISYLLKLRKNIGLVDDIDHLGNRPRPRGWRAHGEPVPHRSGSHGACDQGKDERVSGDVDGHAARPDQRQACHGRDPRVFRLLTAVAVHGSDKSSVGDHA